MFMLVAHVANGNEPGGDDLRMLKLLYWLTRCSSSVGAGTWRRPCPLRNHRHTVRALILSLHKTTPATCHPPPES